MSSEWEGCILLFASGWFRRCGEDWLDVGCLQHSHKFFPLDLFIFTPWRNCLSFLHLGLENWPVLSLILYLETIDSYFVCTDRSMRNCVTWPGSFSHTSTFLIGQRLYLLCIFLEFRGLYCTSCNSVRLTLWALYAISTLSPRKAVNVMTSYFRTGDLTLSSASMLWITYSPLQVINPFA